MRSSRGEPKPAQRHPTEGADLTELRVWRPLAWLTLHHCFTQIGTVHLTHSGVPEYATIFDPSRPCSLLSDDRALHTGDSRPPEVDAVDLPPPVVGATGAGHVCVPRGSAFAGPSYLLHRGPSLSPTVHRPALRGASRWFLPRSACPNNSAWARMVTGPTSSASTDVHWG